MMCSLSPDENCRIVVDDREGPVTTNLYRSTSSPPSSLTGPHVTLTLLCDNATAITLVGSDGPVYGSHDHIYYCQLLCSYNIYVIVDREMRQLLFQTC